MIEWWVIYEYASPDNPKPTPHEQAEPEDRKNLLKRFDAAWKAKTLGDRKVVAMWVLDKASEQLDVPRAEGPCPGDINPRHQEYLSRPNHGKRPSKGSKKRS